MMKAFSKRCLAVVLSIVIAFSITPVSIPAAATAGTYTKITSEDQLETGQYVMTVTVDDSVEAAGTYDGSKTLTHSQVSVVDDKVTISNNNVVWNLSVSGSAVTLVDPNGTAIGAANNAVAGVNSQWTETFNSDGTFSFGGDVSGTKYILSYNKLISNGGFRAYKETTVTGSGYFPKFTLYKKSGGGTTEPVTQKAEQPTASPGSGSVVSGSAITLSSSVSGASIQYSTVSSNSGWGNYIEPIQITENSTIYAKVSADPLGAYAESDVAVFTYTIQNDSMEDPITVIPEGAVNLKEVLDNTTATSAQTAQTFTTVGQLVYQYGTNGTIDSAILEDVINGEIYGLQVYKSGGLAYDTGDIIKITGKAYKYGSVVQLTSPATELLVPAAEASTVIAPQQFNGFSEILALKNSLVSEYVVIKNVTLGTYVSNGSTMVTDSNGVTMPIYKAAPYPSGVGAGENVDLYAAVSKYNTTDQLRNGISGSYAVTNDTKGPGIVFPVFDNAELGKDYAVTATITDNVAVAEAELSYIVKSEVKKVAMVRDSSDSSKWEASIPGTTFTADITGIQVFITAKDTAGNVTISDTKDIFVVDEPQVIDVTPARNGKTGDVKRPLISVTATNLGAAPSAVLTLKTGGTVKLDSVPMSYAEGKFTYTPSEDLADAQYSATVLIARADGKSINYEWTFTVGTSKFNFYFGQLHSHTTYSDGSGSLDDALTYINKISKSDNIDYVAFTDHSNYFDTTSAANPEASLYNKSLMTSGSQTLWNSYKSKIADFNASSENRGVIALGGFEMTWSGGPGHINTWNTEGIVSRNNATLNSKANDAGMKAYYALLSQSEGANTVSQFNHPGKTFGTFSDFAYWDPTIDSRITLIEVGNGEGAIGSGGYFPSYNYYTMALDKGWHVAPTNNQDNHKGKWGNANDGRDVILTDNFTEQGIYDALRERRVYATEDKNLEINYTVNDELMGTIIKEVPEELKVKVLLNDADDAIKKAEVIANSGRIVYTWEVNAQSKELIATLNPDYSYYYIRVTEKDGDIAVTAPVWVGSAKLFGITNVEGSTTTPVTGEAMTVKTTLFNSEASDGEIKSLTYSLDGVVLDQKTDAGMLAKGSSTVVNYNFTPTKAKVQTMSVEAVLTIGGLDYSFTKELNLDVRDSNKLVYIGIDGSHYNEYVAGNYKESMGNFTLLAAQSNVRCVVLNTSEELIAAAKNGNGKYKLLLLTAPSRRNGTALREPYKVYSNEEIAAIKEFSEAGGSLVLCGWSDLYENYKTFPAEDHMAAQQNKLLEAVGASLRISDDAAMDDVLNAGGSEANKARLYLTTYNWDNSFTKDIVFDPEHPQDNLYTQRFSQYGGATIYAVDQEGNPTSILPANVSPIVYGHSTTYSLNRDNDALGGDIPKYEYAKDDNRLMVLASETVIHKNGMQSLVIVDGAAFMSNFEIQAAATDMDTNAELVYSNYTILKNLIQSVNPIQVDKIEKVQQETEEGVKFTVEGVVTSNASGYDKDTAFFDCIYLQDDTAGINAFPVAGNFKIGQKVRITGTTSSYQGERQLNVSTISLLDSSSRTVEVKEINASQVNDRTYLGSLVKLSGTITKVEFANGAVQTILVKDAAGNTARIFIDGYITTQKEIKNLKIGNLITAVGLASYDNTFDGLAARIRIRDRGNIICTQYSEPSNPPKDPDSSPTPVPTDKPVTPVPTDKPVTPVPTDKPVTPVPTDKPVTPVPTNTPVAPVPTNTPVTPAPTKAPAVPTPAATAEEKGIITTEKVVSKVESGKATAIVEIDKAQLKAAAENGSPAIKVSLDSDALRELLTDSRVSKGVVIDLVIPAVKDVVVDAITLNAEALLLAKESGQKLTVYIKNADSNGYAVTIPASELKKITSDSKELDLSVSLVKDTAAAASSIGVLTLGKEGALAAGMIVTVPIGDDLAVIAPEKAYIYLKNPKTGVLEEIPNNQKTIEKNGTLRLSTLSGGEYVICTKKEKDAVKLVDKMAVSVKDSIAAGKKMNVAVKSPQEIAKVKAFTNRDLIGQEEATVAYKVSNKEVATISGNGTITAKKKGTVKVTVTVTLESGQKKSYNKNITVK